MKILLDTHVYLWSITEPRKLSFEALDAIEKASNIYLSVVSLWEISLKFGLGKIELLNGSPELIWKQAKKLGFELLTIDDTMANSFHQLQVIHKDPFDRMIVWQAINNNLTLISKDQKLIDYQQHGLKLIY